MTVSDKYFAGGMRQREDTQMQKRENEETPREETHGDIPMPIQEINIIGSVIEIKETKRERESRWEETEVG